MDYVVIPGEKEWRGIEAFLRQMRGREIGEAAAEAKGNRLRLTIRYVMDGVLYAANLRPAGLGMQIDTRAERILDPLVVLPQSMRVQSYQCGPDYACFALVRNPRVQRLTLH